MVGGRRANAAAAAARSKVVKDIPNTMGPGLAAAKIHVASQSAIQKSYISSGRRAVGMSAAGITLGGMGMYKNRDGSRGGYSAPSTRTARGTGRYA